MKSISSVLALLLSLPLVACGGADKPATQEPRAADDNRMELGDRPTDHRPTGPKLDDDEGDGSGLAVAGLRGHLDEYDIRHGLDPHRRELSTCYTSRIKRRNYIGGKIRLHFVVNPDGTVKAVNVGESDLGAWEIEACILGVARAMTFARPHGGEAVFDIPLEFSGKRAVTWWEEDKADQEVATKLTELSTCQPSPADAWVTLYVGTRGKVLSAGFSAPSGAAISDDWATCAAQAMKAWKLSDPKGKIAKVSFRYAPDSLPGSVEQ